MGSPARRVSVRCLRPKAHLVRTAVGYCSVSNAQHYAVERRQRGSGRSESHVVDAHGLVAREVLNYSSDTRVEFSISLSPRRESMDLDDEDLELLADPYAISKAERATLRTKRHQRLQRILAEHPNHRTVEHVVRTARRTRLSVSSGPRSAFARAHGRRC
jgi:hypothetical protein